MKQTEPCRTCICFTTCKIRYQEHNLVYRCEKLTNYIISMGVKFDYNLYWRSIEKIFGKSYKKNKCYISG